MELKKVNFGSTALILQSHYHSAMMQRSLEYSFDVHMYISHPVTQNACACVCGLDVSDEGDVVQFGEEEQQQTLHSNR